MKSAAGKRPPDEAHGPGKEAIRSRQLCLGESRKEGAHGHAALVPLESNRKTMKSASGKRPPDKAHSAPEKKLSSRISCA